MPAFLTPVLRTEFVEKFKTWRFSIAAYNELTTGANLGELAVDQKLVSRRLYFAWQCIRGAGWADEHWEFQGKINGYCGAERRFSFPVAFAFTANVVSLVGGVYIPRWWGFAGNPARSVDLARSFAPIHHMSSTGLDPNAVNVPNSIYLAPGFGAYGTTTSSNAGDYLTIPPFNFVAEIDTLKLDLDFHHTNVAAEAAGDWRGYYYFACFSQHPLPGPS